jgi:hypothetical protein
MAAAVSKSMALDSSLSSSVFSLKHEQRGTTEGGNPGWSVLHYLNSSNSFNIYGAGFSLSSSVFSL